MIAGTAILALSASGILAGQSQQTIGENYRWSSELVSFDATAKAATVKARTVDGDAIADLKRFKVGDRVMLVWSGFNASADAIRRVMPSAEGSKAGERFVLPVELVSTETPNQYITFRVRVPDTAVGTLTAMKPGEWVTATSPHRPAREDGAIVSMRRYWGASDSTD